MLSVSLPGQDTALEHSRQVNMERTTNMPNFVADEVVRHYVARRNADVRTPQTGNMILRLRMRSE